MKTKSRLILLLFVFSWGIIAKGNSNNFLSTHHLEYKLYDVKFALQGKVIPGKNLETDPLAIKIEKTWGKKDSLEEYEKYTGLKTKEYKKGKIFTYKDPMSLLDSGSIGTTMPRYYYGETSYAKVETWKEVIIVFGKAPTAVMVTKDIRRKLNFFFKG